MEGKSDDHDDYVIDDLLKEKKKKVDGGKKGKRVERDLVKQFTNRFGEGFSRSIGSGNRTSQVSYLPKHAQDTFTGDLCCPKGFRFVLESKGGYNGIDLNTVFESGNSTLDGFLAQVTKDSNKCGRKPMLLWKRDRKPWLAFIHTEEIDGPAFKYRLIYGRWTCVLLSQLLELDDEFFFDGTQSCSD